MCLAGTAAAVGHAGGGGDLRERLQLFTPPRVPCAHLTAATGECGQAFHTIHQRPLHSAVSCSPTSRSGPVPGPHKVNKGVHTPPLPLPEDRKPGLGCDLKLTTDTKLSLTLQKLEAVDATTFTVKVILKLSLPCPEVTPAQSLQFALVPVVESCGRCEWAAAPASCLQGPLHLAFLITDKGSTVFTLERPGLVGASGKPHSPSREGRTGEGLLASLGRTISQLGNGKRC